MCKPAPGSSMIPYPTTKTANAPTKRERSSAPPRKPYASPPPPSADNSKGAGAAPSPLAGEGVGRRPTDEGSHRRLWIALRRARGFRVLRFTPQPAGFAGHHPPQGGKEPAPLHGAVRPSHCREIFSFLFLPR